MDKILNQVEILARVHEIEKKLTEKQYRGESLSVDDPLSEDLHWLFRIVRYFAYRQGREPAKLGILNDLEIEALVRRDPPMISPFVPEQMSKPTFGLGSFGYDIRLGRTFLIPLGGVNVVLDPLRFPRDHFQRYVVPSHQNYFDLAPHSMALAESVEEFHLPDDVLGICVGKSTYARCGLLVNVTPAEPSWNGRLTLELNNLSPLPIRLYVERGIAQMVFFRGERPSKTYAEKGLASYQNQRGVTLPQ